VICLTHLKPIARIREKLLNVGAEDCLPVQHVTAGELQATILRRIASRGLSPKSSVVDVGDMTVNFSEQKACCGDLIGTFTALEWVLFKALAENAPGYVLYDDLEHIKSPHSDYEDRGIIPVIMYRIRRILKNIGASVEVECKDGIGYRLTSKIPKTN
jgi:DNA-binding response OmpR family regulator